MRYGVVLSRTAHRNVNRLPAKAYEAIAEFMHGPLAENPKRVGKPLRGQLEGSYSARVGSYRIIYDIDDAVLVVEVIRIGPRAHVYKRF